MATPFKKVQSKAVTLYASIGGTDTSMRVSPFPLDLDGNKLTMAAFGSTPQLTVDPKILGVEEIIGFTGLTDNGDNTGTYTGLSRDLASSSLSTPGTGKPHGAGAKVVISWNPQDVARTAGLENDQNFTGLNTFDQAPQSAVDPVLPNDLTRLSYVQALVLGTLTTIDVIVPGKAGTTITVGQLVYFDDPTNRWLKAGASASATCENVLLGIAQGAGTAGAAITGGVLLQGLDTHQSGLSEGQTYYASNTPGAIASTPGTKNVVVGIGSTTATTLYFDPRFNQQLTQDQFNALAGTSGTPSSTNKYVTNDDTAATSAASKIVRADSNGKIDSSFLIGSKAIKFGGTGTDGALSIASGVTTIDLGGATYFEKNYTSISITGTGSLAFSNPSSAGTIIVLKSQGAVTLTSSTAPMIDASGLGSAGGAGAICVAGAGITAGGTASSANANLFKVTGGGGANTATPSVSVAGAVPSFIYNNVSWKLQKYNMVGPGSGGGGGNAIASPAGGATTATGGTGGRGGGALVIECAGAWNFTTTGGISVAGKNGTNGAVSNTANRSGGGGGGGGGFFLGLYNTLTADTGTITVTAGTGGNTPSGITDATNNGGGAGGASPVAAGNAGTNNVGASTKDGGDGGTGYSLTALNTEFA